ncbi:hypothetical protein [Nocardia transvalensis]|uniref:hypothetical protein n=1 Tax=Nocardia transvalensis TaxID=37333 RepID=UPI0018947725|nr:hypothetical protein [Nocardia transvalensis]MBF6330650.1 hypothetical protein [Nocardia transvalensis]
MLWQKYLDGAVAAYRRYGIEHVLEYDTIADGASTSLFFVVTDCSGEVVAGVRAQGPYTDAEQAHALAEWRGCVGRLALRQMIADRITMGVVELKGWWVERNTPLRSQVADAAARCALHIPLLLGARYSFATVASFAVDRHRSSGARVAEHIPAAPYPDDRYRTVPIWWDAWTYRTQMAAGQVSLVETEQRALRATAGCFRLPGLMDVRTAEARRRNGR